MPYRNDEVKDLELSPKWALVPTHEEDYKGLVLPGVLMLLVSLPLLLSVVFAPVGLGVLAVAALMGLWGLVAVVFRR